MPRRPNPNPPTPDEQMRISFLLDIRRDPELAYLRDLRGHGDRPRELLRLAVLGLKAEAEMKDLMDSARAAKWGNANTNTKAREPEQEAPVVRRAKPVAPVVYEEDQDDDAPAPVRAPAPVPTRAHVPASANMDLDDDDDDIPAPVHQAPVVEKQKSTKSNPKAASIARGLLA